MPPKIKKIRLFLGRASLLLSFFGPCIAQATPEFSCIGTKIGKETGGLVQVQLQMRAKNPEPRPIHLEYGVVDLRVDHQRFGQAHLSSLVFPAKTSKDFLVTVLVPAERLWTLVWEHLTDAKIPWHAQGTLEVDHRPMRINQRGVQP